MSELLPTAQLSDASTPTSAQFDDIYFSPSDGVGESHYHFIVGNQLDERFARAETFIVAETGFGTGLNFLLTARLWQSTHNHQPRQQGQLPTLHYFSAEKYPITAVQLADIYRAQVWQDALSEVLIAQYPRYLTRGRHDMLFAIDGVCVRLSLLLGDATACFNDCDCCVDAWFLDGFAPRKNPAMWTQALFEVMAKRSRVGTTFATFTAASAVRKGLQAAGFNVQKGKGFGRKRERLLGYFNG